MALSIKALNNDTSFLLTFAPSITPSDVKTPELFPGAYTILIDPWLSGPATILSQKFSVQEHTSPSCIESLRDLPEPDMVLISQDKPDHCHEETLCQLSPHVRSIILGPSKACKKIRGWRHFDLGCVQCLKPYNPRDPTTVFRLEIPPFSANGTPGELTVCLLEPKRDLSGLHNAIGLTYRPPSSVLSVNLNSYKNLAPPSSSPTTATGISPPSPVDSPTSPTSNPPLPPPPSSDTLSDPRPKTPKFVSATANTIVPSPNPSTRQTEKTLSVLYTPHGVPYAALEPWATAHLVTLAALPPTLFLHGFNAVEAPWYLGGNMMAGLPGGLEIVRKLLPRVWVGVHDEEKKLRGAMAGTVRKTGFGLEEVEKRVGEALGGEGKGGKRVTEVVRLESGKEMRLGFKELGEVDGRVKVL